MGKEMEEENWVEGKGGLPLQNDGPVGLFILPYRAVDSTSEKRLITMLVENYRQNGVDGRPVVNTSTALAVTISFSLIQILQFDQTRQVITLVGWISLVCDSTHGSFHCQRESGASAFDRRNS